VRVGGRFGVRVRETLGRESQGMLRRESQGTLGREGQRRWGVRVRETLERVRVLEKGRVKAPGGVVGSLSPSESCGGYSI
jgi:hypothetical protein